MILVAGGTGVLGQLLLPILSARGETVRVLSRTGRAGTGDLPNVGFVTGDVRDRTSVDEVMSGVSSVVSAVQGFGGPTAAGVSAVDGRGNANLIASAAAAGVKRFVLMSIYGASPDHASELFRAKAEAERRLAATTMDWTIIRPTAYQETWLELIGRPLVESGRTRLFGSGRNPINFVSAGDVARIVDLALSDPRLGGATIEIPGPEDLTFEAFVDIVRDVTGVRGSVSHVPLPILRLLSLALRPIRPILAAQAAMAVVMETCDMTADPSGRIRLFPSVAATRLSSVVADRIPVPAGALADHRV